MKLASPHLWPRFIRRRMPSSLWGRALLIIVLPVALMQVAVTWAFFDAEWESTSARLSDSLAGDVAWLSQSYRDNPSPADLKQLHDRAQDEMELSVVLQPGAKLPVYHRHSFFAPFDRMLLHALGDHLKQ